MRKMPRRRFTDKIRELADAAWARGDKDRSSELHNVAYKAEQERKDKHERNV